MTQGDPNCFYTIKITDLDDPKSPMCLRRFTETVKRNLDFRSEGGKIGSHDLGLSTSAVCVSLVSKRPGGSIHTLVDPSEGSLGLRLVKNNLRIN